MSAISGVCAAALTPLDRDDSPDLAATVRHCRRLFALGCDALNVLGTTGEAMSFTVAQRVAVMQSIAESDVPVKACIAGTGAAALADAVVLTRAAFDLGFAGELVMPPFYFKDNTDDGLMRFFSRLIERVDRPGLALYLYHFPYVSGVSFSASLVTRLVHAFPGTVVGLKDSSGVAGYAEAIVATSPIAVFPSSEATLALARERGFAGCISATVNVSAPLAAAVWHNSAHDPHSAEDAQMHVTAIRTAIAAYPLVPAIRGVIAALTGEQAWRRVVPPLHELSSADEAALMERLRAMPAFASLGEAYAACA